MICMPICNHFHVGQANSTKIMSFSGGAPFALSYLRGPASPSGMKFYHEILETRGYHAVKTQSLYLTWSWIGTTL